jgi:hypothetical protein
VRKNRTRGMPTICRYGSNCKPIASLEFGPSRLTRETCWKAATCKKGSKRPQRWETTASRSSRVAG